MYIVHYYKYQFSFKQEDRNTSSSSPLVLLTNTNTIMAGGNNTNASKSGGKKGGGKKENSNNPNANKGGGKKSSSFKKGVSIPVQKTMTKREGDKKPAVAAEKRTDPSDNNGPFSFASFIKYHGKELGESLWEQAGDLLAAEEGVSKRGI